MPKQFRQCNFCTSSSVSNPDVTIFTANDDIKYALNVPRDIISYICEEHFDPSDVKIHGNSKRLCDGAVPVNFPRQEAVLLDHNYVQTTPLDLVRIIVSNGSRFLCGHVFLSITFFFLRT